MKCNRYCGRQDDQYVFAHWCDRKQCMCKYCKKVLKDFKPKEKK